jgi:enamine deaminase RidA (YjgF/YER057c/UK114 family)
MGERLTSTMRDAGFERSKDMTKIDRLSGWVPTRRLGSAYKDLVWVTGMSDDLTLGAKEQTVRAYANLDKILAEAGTDKTRVISATVILHDIEDKPMADLIWADWIGDDPANWPDRSCHGVTLHAGNRIEIRVVAVR